MTRLSLLLCVSLLAFACSKKPKTDGENSFTQRYALNAKIYDKDIFTKLPQLFLIDSLAIVFSGRSTSEKLIRVYSIADDFREVGAYDAIGRGPSEFIKPYYPSIAAGDMYIQETQGLGHSEIVRIGFSESGEHIDIRETWRSEFEYPEAERFASERFFRPKPRSVVRLTDYFVGMAHNSSPGFFSLWDDELNFVRFFGNAPVDEEIDIIISMRHLHGYTRSFGNRMVFAMSDLPYLALYEVNDGEPVQKWTQYFLEPVYRVDGGSILFDKQKTFGMTRGLSLGENYIYLAFLDALLSEVDNGTASQESNIILVFDYDGNRVARLDLDQRVSSIAVSADDRKLYGIVDTPDGYRFAEFDLPKFRE